MLRQPISLGLVAACSILLAGCEASTSPSPSGAPNLSRSLSRDEAPAHTVVVTGTGNPSVDVPAVQAAVNQWDNVVLKGHFSFAAPATKPLAPALLATAAALPPAAEVLVSRAVTISGGERDDEMAQIDGGTIPFYVDAPGSRVTIRGLHFVHPISASALVYAVQGLEFASNHIEGIDVIKGNASAIWIVTTGVTFSPTSPGNPQNISGKVSIVDNYIDAMGVSGANSLGVTVFSAGVQGAEVEFDVSRNTIKNVTEPAINLRRIVGRARIEHNVIATGPLVGTAARSQVIRVVNIGTYVISHNSIDCGWADPEGEGIGVFSQYSAWPMEHAVVMDNDITMSAPAGTSFTEFSAGIAVYGFANANIVRGNTIHGRARAALSIPVFTRAGEPTPAPADNAFIRNRFVGFTPSSNFIYVGSQALRTQIVGATPDMVVDHGSQTTIQPPAHDVEPTAAARWNAVARAQTLTHTLSQQLGSRIFAYLSLAQYNAAVAAENAKGDERRPSVPAAVAAASAAVLGSFYPDQTAAFDALLAAEQSQSPEHGDRHADFAAGAAIGRAEGAAVIARAAKDGFTSSVDGVVIPVCPGCWTSAKDQLPIFPRLNEMRTFFLKTASQFRPGLPPAFGSPAFLTDLAEVRAFSDNRTHVQDSIAKFWAKPGGFSVAAAYANELATREIDKFHLHERSAAHVLAVMNMAAMDAFIASHDAKYTYWMIRPPQADPGIVPDIPLPNHPSYPSNHASVTGCAMAVLAAFFPSDAAYLNGLADQAAISRVYGGIHYRFDMNAGLVLGRTVASYALHHDVNDDEAYAEK